MNFRIDFLHDGIDPVHPAALENGADGRVGRQDSGGMEFQRVARKIVQAKPVADEGCAAQHLLAVYRRGFVFYDACVDGVAFMCNGGRAFGCAL